MTVLEYILKKNKMNYKEVRNNKEIYYIIFTGLKVFQVVGSRHRRKANLDSLNCFIDFINKILWIHFFNYNIIFFVRNGVNGFSSWYIGHALNFYIYYIVSSAIFVKNLGYLHNINLILNKMDSNFLLIRLVKQISNMLYIYLICFYINYLNNKTFIFIFSLLFKNLFFNCCIVEMVYDLRYFLTSLYLKWFKMKKNDEW